MAGIGFAPRRPVVAEDIRDLQRWTGHGAVFTALAVGLPAQRAIAQRFCALGKSGRAKSTQSCPLSAADRKSFEPSEHSFDGP
jgi:hypothetical protein